MRACDHVDLVAAYHRSGLWRNGWTLQRALQDDLIRHCLALTAEHHRRQQVRDDGAPPPPYQPPLI